MGGWIAIGVVVILVLALVGMYNGLVRLRNTVQEAWGQIDVQLKRRHDLIPNLVQTVKGYMKHEQETLEKVIKARQMAVDAKNMGERMQAENMLTNTLRSLFAVQENYPQLKADQHASQLMEELTSTENKIAFARQRYNDVVLQYNNKRESVPSNVIAGMFNFKEADFFKEEDEAVREAPKVSF
ncbi:MAG: LemA family protein [Deltaproteobacteria bacterium]|nr:LemA family protein [Deltaproteobacteria bacterium]